MSLGADRTVVAETDQATALLSTLVLCFLLVLVGGAIALSFSGVTAAEETNNLGNETANVSPPVLADAERVSDTVINVTVDTEVGLDAETVGPGEFFLSAGSLDRASVVHSSDDDQQATVKLELLEPVAEDEVVIGVASSTRIADTAGNTLNTSERSSVRVTGMDAVPPDLLSVDIPSISTNETTVGYQFDQSVDDLTVTIDGPIEKELTRDDFEGRPNLAYTADIELEEGEYTVTLHEATDRAGNTAEFGIESPLEINTSIPTAIAEVNRTASAGTTVAFDGNRSDSTAESFEWTFGDGETATGTQVEHTFHPGVYEVTLETTDAAGNVGTDEIIVEVSNDDHSPRVGPHHWPAEPEVSVERPSRAFGVDSLVEFVGVAAGETVTAPNGDDPLITTDETTVESLSVTPTTETSIGLGLTGIERNEAVATAFAEETEMNALGGFSAAPTVSSDVIDEVELTLTVTEDAIADADASIDDVVLYHGNGGWDERETAVRDESDGVYELAVTTDGFSSFILAVPDAEDEDDEGEDEANGEDESNEEDSGNEDEEGDEADDQGEDESDETEDEETADEDENDEDESEEDDGTANESDDGEDANETDETDEEESPPTAPEEQDDESGAFLGIIPHWLVRTVCVFIALPLFTAYTGLKALAFYLGY